MVFCFLGERQGVLRVKSNENVTERGIVPSHENVTETDSLLS